MSENCDTVTPSVDWKLKTRELNELFLAWQQQHCLEESENTRYARISKDSFTEDGPIVPELYYASSTKILFIGKESNIEHSGKDENGMIRADETFYTRNVALHPEITPRTFVKNLAKLYNALKTGNYEIPDSDTGKLKDAAFINLNKRGGLATCSHRVLRAYTKRYKDWIVEEITLLAPDLIVCCGADCYNIVVSEIAVGSKIGGIPVLAAYHPSARVSDNEKLDKIKRELDKFVTQ